MTMRLNLSSVHANQCCAKPGCKKRLVYRHHRGGEHTFVRHWHGLYATDKKRMLAFAERYQGFHKDDVVSICGDHHEEVHDQMEQFDLDWMVENDCIKAFSRFTWDEAMALVEARQAFTDSWLRTETPGLKQRKFTGRP